MTTTPPEVARRRRDWMAAVNERSLDDYADLVAKDVVWLPPMGDPLAGRQAFRAWLEPFFTRYGYEFSVEPDQVREFAGWCAETGRFRTDGIGGEHAG